MELKIETLNHCHALEEKGYLFKSHDTQSTEDEYLHLLHALVRCLKPEIVLETGAFKGIGTAILAKALRQNSESQNFIPHRGRIFSVEIDPACARYAAEQLLVNGVSEYGAIICRDSMEFLGDTEQSFDFAFFDSQLPLRAKELQLCLNRGILREGSFFAMHDTSRLRITTPGNHDTAVDEMWKELEAVRRIKFLEFPLSRGLVLGQVTSGN